MNKKIDIGASISSRTDASSTVENIFSAEDFPCTLNIQNHTVTRLILPELKALDVTGLGSVDAHFNDIGLLKRVVSSLAQISRLSNFSRIATICSPDFLETEKSPELEAAPAATTQTNEAPEDQKKEVQDDDEITATVIEELPGGVLCVAANGIQFEVKKNQLRENGTLTAGGISAYQAAKNPINE